MRSLALSGAPPERGDVSRQAGFRGAFPRAEDPEDPEHPGRKTRARPLVDPDAFDWDDGLELGRARDARDGVGRRPGALRVLRARKDDRRARDPEDPELRDLR